MTKEERIQEDIAELEYLRKWKMKKESRQYYKNTMKEHLKWAWYSFKKYVQGS